MKAELFPAAEAPHIPWPDTPAAHTLKAWITPMLQEGTRPFFDNVDTELWVVVCGEVALPLSVGQRGPDNAYVCSPFAHYLTCALDETRTLDGFTRILSLAASWPVAALFRLGELDKVVMVNNWLLSTNLYPRLSEAQVQAIQEVVRGRWPHHVTVWRSVDLGLRGELHGWLTALGARMVFSRRVHITDVPSQALRRKNNKHDARISRRSPWRPTTEVSPGAALALYRQLYIDKYSPHNPQFTERLIAHGWASGVWSCEAWVREGEVGSVVGTWALGGVMTTPLLGYDTTQPQREGLYRLACLGILRRGAQEDLKINQSAGAARFKQTRGANSYLEFNGVFDGHLGWRRRLPWWLLEVLTRRLVVPLIERRNL